MSTLDTLANAFEFNLVSQSGEWEYAMENSNLVKYIVENEKITLLELLKLYEKEKKNIDISFEENSVRTFATVWIYEDKEFLAKLGLKGDDTWSTWLTKYCSL